MFLSRLVVHALCLEQLYCCTDILYTSTLVHCAHKSWRQHGLSRWRILTNKSTSSITFMNHVNQSQGLKSARTPDRQQTPDRVGDIIRASVLLRVDLKIKLSKMLTYFQPNIKCRRAMTGKSPKCLIHPVVY